MWAQETLRAFQLGHGAAATSYGGTEVVLQTISALAPETLRTALE